MSNISYLGTLRTKSFSRPRILSKKRLKSFKLPLLITALHIPFGVLSYQINNISVIHQLVVFGLGLYWAIRKKEKLEKIAYVCAYIIGMEIMWRMTLSSIFWEFGKYSVVVIMITALVRRGCLKIPILPLFYLFFLVPGCLLTMFDINWSIIKDVLSFNMSGPFFLFVSCWYFSHLKVNMTQLKYLLFSMIVPIISVAISTLFFTATTENIVFDTESNFSTSGGFGPNQVSSILGLGVFICVLCFLIFRNNSKETIYLGILTLLFFAQSIMTFSRGGMYNAVGGILAAGFFQMNNFVVSIRRIFPILVVGGIFLIIVFPYLNNFTGGKLVERFEDSNTTQRSEIIEADYQVFLEHPVLGVGVGNAPEARAVFSDRARLSHTEFTRILSEHGAFGIMSLIALAIASLLNLQRQNLLIGKALVAGVVIWSALMMTNAAMRVAAPSFLWGLSFITIVTPRFGTRRIARLKE